MKTAVPKVMMLVCKNLDGSKRYTLPGVFVGSYKDFQVYYRSQPEVIHHKHKKHIMLDQSEVILVSTNEHFVVSASLDSENEITGMYCNINLPPVFEDSQFSWRDLELDLKLVKNHSGTWSAILLDVDEYLTADLSSYLRALAEKQVQLLFDRVMLQEAPFGNEFQTWLKLKLQEV